MAVLKEMAYLATINRMVSGNFSLISNLTKYMPFSKPFTCNGSVVWPPEIYISSDKNNCLPNISYTPYCRCAASLKLNLK